MSDLLPKEKQSAYQRWEMASFGDTRPSAPEPVVVKANIEEIARIRDEARNKGYHEGVAEGLEEGRAAGLAESRVEMARALIHLQEIAQTFGVEVAHANEVIADDLLNLSLDISKAILKTTLTVRPEVIIPIVGEAIRYLPTLQQPALLFLNPDDAQLIRTHMEDELTKAGWRVAEDPRMERGGCRIETASNQIDATIETRWQRVAAALGKDLDWLEK